MLHRTIMALLLVSVAMGQTQIDITRNAAPQPSPATGLVFGYLPGTGTPWLLGLDPATFEITSGILRVKTQTGPPSTVLPPVGGPLGAVVVTPGSPGNPDQIDLVTSVVPFKQSANVWTGSNDYSRAVKTAPFRTGAALPATCNSVIREFFYLTSNNTLMVCNGTDLWAPVTGAPPALRMRQLRFTLSAGQRTITLSEVPAPNTSPLVFHGPLLQSPSEYTVAGAVLTLTGTGWQSGDNFVIIYFY